MKKLIIAFLGFLLLYGIFYFYGDTWRSCFFDGESHLSDYIAQEQEFNPAQGVILEIGNAVVETELAVTYEARTIGLSGRDTLPDNTGMLFVYDQPDYYQFWMPDMHFSLDMIWFDTNFSVVDITRNATPESFPQKFTPKAPAQFVLEVPAGYAQEKGIEVGMNASIRQ